MPKKPNFRDIVRGRDKWTCQKCGSVEYPQVHHIAPVKDYPLFQYLPDNGLTLCVYCHADAHPEVPRNLFIANVIKAEKEGYISAGKLAKELEVHPRTIVRRARKLDILKPMQKWMFTKKEVDLIRENPCREAESRRKAISFAITPEMGSKLAKINTVCDLLQISKSTLWKWRRKYPDLPVLKIENTVRFDLYELREWSAKN